MKSYYFSQLDNMRQQGHRITPQRQLVLDALITHNGHATIAELVETVAATAPAINKATIYRVLEFFSSQHLVSKTEIDGQFYYELIGTEPHHHLVCTQCGHVAHLANKHLAPLADHLEQTYGFQANLNHLAIHGICQHCQTNSS